MKLFFLLIFLIKNTSLFAMEYSYIDFIMQNEDEAKFNIVISQACEHPAKLFAFKNALEHVGKTLPKISAKQDLLLSLEHLIKDPLDILHDMQYSQHSSGRFSYVKKLPEETDSEKILKRLALIWIIEDSNDNPWTRIDAVSILNKLEQDHHKTARHYLHLSQDESIDPWCRISTIKKLIHMNIYKEEALELCYLLSQKKDICPDVISAAKEILDHPQSEHISSPQSNRPLRRIVSQFSIKN